MPHSPCCSTDHACTEHSSYTPCQRGSPPTVLVILWYIQASSGKARGTCIVLQLTRGGGIARRARQIRHRPGRLHVVLHCVKESKLKHGFKLKRHTWEIWRTLANINRTPTQQCRSTHHALPPCMLARAHPVHVQAYAHTGERDRPPTRSVPQVLIASLLPRKPCSWSRRGRT